MFTISQSKMKRGTLQKTLDFMWFPFWSRSPFQLISIQYIVVQEFSPIYPITYLSFLYKIIQNHIFTPMFRFLLLFIHVSLKYWSILNASVLSSVRCCVLNCYRGHVCVFIPHDKLINSLSYETVTSTLHPHKHSNRPRTQN